MTVGLVLIYGAGVYVYGALFTSMFIRTTRCKINARRAIALWPVFAVVQAVVLLNRQPKGTGK